MSSELLVESLSVLLYTAAAALLTAGGTLAEYTSLQHYGSGELMVALWLAAIGGVMLYAGVYGIAYQKVLARVVAHR
ncbi:hypothetical protein CHINAEXTREME_05430 [Halobiforma lacisalsi AJ5]|uniref:DUF8151 domain-containing protein n=1 Tax=Natronobacterium lacisalsi AJ5 TaxID=358396 RepID=M0LNY9_NATLA|nr:hypothetical protein [Halobiforma lacisalsi]APW97246.1 hypothetical protein CHINAEXTREME_05430 [Halobiforma lacisalsi AJ5]EMA33755.1 hypothetical protein C445_08704 [Halobiforma lacisalsi AJ5]